MRYLGIIILVLIASFLAYGIFLRDSEAPGSVGGIQTENERQGEAAAKFVTLQTNFGAIKIELREDAAPKTAANFVKLARDGFYNGLTFHRVIPGFVIQGGDPLSDGTGGPGYTLQAEINLPHTRGAVAMARLPDEVNPERRSSGSQFYIALVDLPQLDGQYTVFGQVVEGMDRVDRIAQIPIDSNHRPRENVIIEKVEIN